MTRDKMLKVIGLLNPATGRIMNNPAWSDDDLEAVLVHEAMHIKVQRDREELRKSRRPYMNVYGMDTQ